MGIRLSYAITVCNEFEEIQRLVSFLLENKRRQDEIVILYDESNGDSKIEEYLRSVSINGELNWHKDKFNHNFADWKNKLTSLCNGDYVFNIDADEIPHESLLKSLPDLLESNREVDVITIPRINTVEGLTSTHIAKWGWVMNEKGWVNWPDYQARVYKINSDIKWTGHVHETLTGHKGFSFLPLQEEWALYHPKTIQKQEKQNNYYSRL